MAADLSRRRRSADGKRSDVKDKAMIAHTDRLVMTKVRQWNCVGRTLTTEYLYTHHYH